MDVLENFWQRIMMYYSIILIIGLPKHELHFDTKTLKDLFIILITLIMFILIPCTHRELDRKAPNLYCTERARGWISHRSTSLS